MRNRDEKLLAEAYLRVLKEQQPAPQPVNQAGLIDINSTPDQVLAAAAKIPQNILLAGQTDGNPNDEKIAVVENPNGPVPANTLIPTQSEIGTSQSLDDQIMDKFGALDKALKGTRMGSAAGDFPVLTFGGRYILDGHHRWSQFMATNPTAKIDIADIQAQGVKTPDAALNLVHLILMALYGKSPTKPFKGENLIGMSPQKIAEYVRNKITDSALQKLAAARKIKSPNRDEAAQYYANNLSQLKGGKYSRIYMPQPADAGDPSQMTKVPQKAAAGEINYIAPKQTDVQQAINTSTQ